jgi:hypothetical protein
MSNNAFENAAFMWAAKDKVEQRKEKGETPHEAGHESERAWLTAEHQLILQTPTLRERAKEDYHAHKALEATPEGRAATAGKGAVLGG